MQLKDKLFKVQHGNIKQAMLRNEYKNKYTLYSKHTDPTEAYKSL